MEQKSPELLALLNLLENPIKEIKIKYDKYGNQDFCRVSNKYVNFPKEITDNDGNKTVSCYKSGGIRIRNLNDETYPIYVKIICDYEVVANDIYKNEYWDPKVKEIKTPRNEHIKDIKDVDKNREQFIKMIEDKRKAYREEMESLGVRLGGGSYYIENWPDNCVYLDKWYNITNINDYGRSYIGITMHKQTELYKELYKGEKGSRIIDKIKAGSNEKID